jgi:hypothetical protein
MNPGISEYETGAEENQNGNYSATTLSSEGGGGRFLHNTGFHLYKTSQHRTPQYTFIQTVFFFFLRF